MLPLQAFLPGLTSSPEHVPYSDSVTSLGEGGGADALFMEGGSVFAFPVSSVGSRYK